MNSRVTDLSNESLHFNAINGLDETPIVSFDNCISQLSAVLTNIGSEAKLCEMWFDNGFDLPPGISKDAALALHLYTREFKEGKEKSLYYILNAFLRERNRQNLKTFFPYLRLLLSGLELLPKYSYSNSVWRGVKGNITNNYKVGNKKCWWGFSSCTTSLESVKGFLGDGEKTLFNIHFNFGFEINNFSAFPDEHEILLPPGRYFEVRNATHIEGGLYIVELYEMMPPCELIKFNHKGPPQPPTTATTYLLNPQYGGIIEAFDSINWYVSRIINVFPSSSSILIHYEGWDTHWDETLHVLHNATRIRPLSGKPQIGSQLSVSPKTLLSTPSMSFGPDPSSIRWPSPDTLPLPHPLLWDLTFSKDLITVSSDRKTCTFVKSSQVVGYSDYALYPAARIEGGFTDLFSVKIVRREHGWFGVGSGAMSPYGFPGYTSEGWMFSTEGLLWHNKQGKKIINFPQNATEFKFTFDPKSSSGLVVVGEKMFQFSLDSTPEEVYFVVSIAVGSVTIDK